ncbi:hypothetical protein [Flexithrix dorotheae]|uniref:hypothetical protein n=1 Tax=Flexithrix dorotheae TaxID=70993 RepID=UPI00035DE812|nr:hypothetical protein [Flexithrix dorotheae]
MKAIFGQINFSYNWNRKLNCKYFTTVRLKSEKYQIGRVYDINYSQGSHLEKIMTAEIERIFPFFLKDWKDVFSLDTGYDPLDSKTLIMNMYKNKEINWETQMLYFIMMQEKERNQFIDHQDTLQKAIPYHKVG